MARFIDFAALKEEFPIERAISLLGLQMQKRGDQHRGVCPKCQGGERILAITPAKNTFYCFGCGKGGDVIQLVSLITGRNARDAAAHIDEYMHGPEEEKPQQAVPNGTFKELPYLQPDHEAVGIVGFTSDVAKALGIGYAPKGLMRGTVAVPIRLPNGKLVGYIGLTEARLPNDWHL